MIATFISQCEKKAIKRTRKILDAFASRIGDNVWQTNITEIGLKTVYELLKSTASKSTAVACHRIATRHRTELMWVVGNKSAFNHQGHVPVNRTEKDISQYQDSHLWQNLPVIAVASAIAGLFHDFGKANYLFQQKLNPNKPKGVKNYEPYRHEWLSFKLFEGFVQNKSYQEWVALLATPHQIQESDLLNHINNPNHIDNLNNKNSPFCFNHFDDFTKLVAWLIITHHRLPAYPYFINDPPSLKKADEWLNHCDIKWNSPNKILKDWSVDELKSNWQCHHLPLVSKKWQQKAIQIAQFAQKSIQAIDTFVWQDDLLTMHLSRMALMMSDHYYSAKDKNAYFCDKVAFQLLKLYSVNFSKDIKLIPNKLENLFKNIDEIEDKNIIISSNQNTLDKIYPQNQNFNDISTDLIIENLIEHSLFETSFSYKGTYFSKIKKQ